MADALAGGSLTALLGGAAVADAAARSAAALPVVVPALSPWLSQAARASSERAKRPVERRAGWDGVGMEVTLGLVSPARDVEPRRQRSLSAESNVAKAKTLHRRSPGPGAGLQRPRQIRR
jgi:hypothetical protein